MLQKPNPSCSVTVSTSITQPTWVYIKAAVPASLRETVAVASLQN